MSESLITGGASDLRIPAMHSRQTESSPCRHRQNESVQRIVSARGHDVARYRVSRASRELKAHIFSKVGGAESVGPMLQEDAGPLWLRSPSTGNLRSCSSEVKSSQGVHGPRGMNFLELRRKDVMEGGGLHKFLRTAVPALPLCCDTLTTDRGVIRDACRRHCACTHLAHLALGASVCARSDICSAEES